jgi:hypothetical protein
MTDDREVKPTAEAWEKVIIAQEMLLLVKIEGSKDATEANFLRFVLEFLQDIRAEARRIAGERSP